MTQAGVVQSWQEYQQRYRNRNIGSLSLCFVVLTLISINSQLDYNSNSDLWDLTFTCTMVALALQLHCVICVYIYSNLALKAQRRFYSGDGNLQN